MIVTIYLYKERSKACVKERAIKHESWKYLRLYNQTTSTSLEHQHARS